MRGSKKRWKRHHTLGEKDFSGPRIAVQPSRGHRRLKKRVTSVTSQQTTNLLTEKGTGCGESERAGVDIVWCKLKASQTMLHFHLPPSSSARRIPSSILTDTLSLLLTTFEAE